MPTLEVIYLGGISNNVGVEKMKDYCIQEHFRCLQFR